MIEYSDIMVSGTETFLLVVEQLSATVIFKEMFGFGTRDEAMQFFTEVFVLLDLLFFVLVQHLLNIFTKDCILNE